MIFPNWMKTQKYAPSRINESITKITAFKGLDLGHTALNVDIQRSPDAKNMLRSEIGQIRKRMGYHKVAEYSSQVNGAFIYKDELFIHSGTNLYRFNDASKTSLGTMANHKSNGYTLNGSYYILDGTKLRVLTSRGSYGNISTNVSGGSVTINLNSFLNAWATYFPNTPITPTQHTITFNGSVWSVSVSGTSCILGTTQQMRDNLFITLNGVPTSGNTITLDLRGYTLSNVDSIADSYIPTVIISRNPSGGGTAYESYNLMNGLFKNSFYVNSSNASATAFVLTSGTLDSGSENDVVVKVMNSSGEFITKTRGTDYSVNVNTATITFNTAPGQSPISGTDNVIITAKHTISGNADKINKCTISALYGINGASDRLFVSGNSDFPNRDYWSAKDDPTYFGELNYSTLGQESSPIVGYSIVNSYLATHKADAEDGQTIFIRNGSLTSGSMVSIGGEEVDTSEITFKIINTLSGMGSISYYSHVYLGKEPLFLTKNGIYAITSEDVTGEKISQSRSYYLDAKLRQESNLENAIAIFHDNFYMLFINGNVYCLDYLQKTFEKNQPYSSYQYEGYLLDNIPARVVWEKDGELYFGSSSGKVYKFYTDESNLASYSDENGDGTTSGINAYWTTPFISGDLRYSRKNFKYFATTLAPFSSTGVSVYGKKLGIWNKLFDDYASANYVDFANVNFNYFSFSTDTSPTNVRKPIWIGVVDKAQFKLENSQKNMPFGIYDISIEFIESNKF